jgi:hypothetical protein
VILLLSRLEDLSHILVWTKTNLRAPNEPCTIDVVEMPRLGLTFRARPVGFWMGSGLPAMPRVEACTETTECAVHRLVPMTRQRGCTAMNTMDTSSQTAGP